MLFNKYILAVAMFLVMVVSVSAAPQIGLNGQVGNSLGSNLVDIAPTKINVETEGKWFVEKRNIEVVRIHPKKINQIKEKSKILERVGSKEILIHKDFGEIENTILEKSECKSVGTELYKKATFDCSEGILYDDDKDVTLITSNGKKYSSLEMEFPLKDKLSKELFLKIDQRFEFPHQQKTRVFVKVNNIWKPVCNNVAQGQMCDLGSIANDKELLKIRLENYAREGVSEWSINEVSLFSPSLNHIIPIPANIRPINPPPGGMILPGPFGNEFFSEDDENDGHLETEEVTVELELNPEELILEDSKDSEEIANIETMPSESGQSEESSKNPSKITGFAVADLVGNNGVGIVAIIFLVAGLIALRFRINKKRFVIP